MSIVGEDFAGGRVGEAQIVYPRRVFIPHANFTVLVGGALQFVLVTNQWLNPPARQNPQANGDSWTHSFVIRAGTYTLTVHGLTTTDGAKLDLYYKHETDSGFTLIASGLDWYSGSTVANIRHTASVTLPKSGYYTLKGVVNGKNPGSSGYSVYLSALLLAPAAD